MLALGAAMIALGCGGGGEDTTSDAGTAAAGSTGDAGSDVGSGQGHPGRGTAGAPQGGPELSKSRAAFRSCLERHGVSLPARPGAGDVLARLDELRSAGRKCREELQKSPQAGSGSAPQVRQWRRRAQREAASQARRFAAFRACMGRHGFGPEAEGNAQSGDVREAFARCREELPVRPRG
jgi:hypothetical protein